MLDGFRRFAQQLAFQVSAGFMTDCNALAVFADNAAATTNDNLANFIEAFRVFYDSGSGGYLNGVALQGNNSGFLLKYQDMYPFAPNNNDQVHHFACFFELGGLVGISGAPDGSSIVAAVIGHELTQLTPYNIGDFNLGLVACVRWLCSWKGIYVASCDWQPDSANTLSALGYNHAIDRSAMCVLGDSLFLCAIQGYSDDQFDWARQFAKSHGYEAISWGGCFTED